MAIKDALLPEFDHEMAVTRRVLERVPMGEAAWTPHPKSMSLGRLASHLADIPSWAPTILEKPGYDMAAGANAPHAEHTSREALLEAFDRNVQQARAAIAARSDAEMLAPWTLRAGEHVVFTQPRVGALRGFLFSHSIHHRGQMSVYLRLRDVPVPSIYGPSADEP